MQLFEPLFQTNLVVFFNFVNTDPHEYRNNAFLTHWHWHRILVYSDSQFYSRTIIYNTIQDRRILAHPITRQSAPKMRAMDQEMENEGVKIESDIVHYFTMSQFPG